MQRLIKLVTTVIGTPVKFGGRQLGLQIEKITTEGDESTMRLVAFLVNSSQTACTSLQAKDLRRNL
jgi:hypothetical protein